MEEAIQKKNVTIGISAHNEEKSIGNVLESLLNQSTENYTLDSITVLCDGCSDNTASIVKSFSSKDSRIICIDDGARMGKIGRVNWLCKNTNSDILVILDADIKLTDNSAIDKLLTGFDDTNVGLVAGLQKPLPARNFWENIFITWESIWIETRKSINGGDSVHNISGCNFAMSKSLYQNLDIPKEVIAEDEFMYFANKKAGFKFKFIPEVEVGYRLPGNLHDYFKQSARFMTTKFKIFDYFGESFEDSYTVPTKNKISAMSKVFISRPISTLIAIALQIPVRIYSKFNTPSYNNGTYEISKSTK